MIDPFAGIRHNNQRSTRKGKSSSRLPFTYAKDRRLDSVEDQFPDEHLFAVTMKTPWYADVANYLAVGKLPKHLTSSERKLIVKWNK